MDNNRTSVAQMLDFDQRRRFPVSSARPKHSHNGLAAGLKAALTRKLLRAEYQNDQLTIRDPLGYETAHVNEHIKDSFFRGVSTGSKGVLRSYLANDWSTPDLYQLMMTLFKTERFTHRALTFLIPFNAYLSMRRDSSVLRDYTSVADHYDVDPAIFQSFLAPVWAYSATATRQAEPDVAMIEMYRSNYRQVLNDLELPSPRSTILDLGIGWGAFARITLEETGHSVIGITLSSNQARALRSLEQRFSNRLQIRLGNFLDERILPDSVDAVVLFESIEHVHPRDRSELFRTLHRKYPKAPVFIQATTLNSFTKIQRAGRATVANSVIFPGPGRLPSTRQLVRSAGRADYTLRSAREISAEYHCIAMEWYRRLRTNTSPSEIKRNPGAYRFWEIYLSSLAAALATQNVHSYQLNFEARSM